MQSIASDRRAEFLRAVGRGGVAPAVPRGQVRQVVVAPRVNLAASSANVLWCRNCKGVRAFDKIGADGDLLRCPSCFTSRTRR